jgi:hypothetical protein
MRLTWLLLGGAAQVLAGCLLALVVGIGLGSAARALVMRWTRRG